MRNTDEVNVDGSEASLGVAGTLRSGPAAVRAGISYLYTEVKQADSECAISAFGEAFGSGGVPEEPKADAVDSEDSQGWTFPGVLENSGNETARIRVYGSIKEETDDGAVAACIFIPISKFPQAVCKAISGRKYIQKSNISLKGSVPGVPVAVAPELPFYFIQAKPSMGGLIGGISFARMGMADKAFSINQPNINGLTIGGIA